MEEITAIDHHHQFRVEEIDTETVSGRSKISVGITPIGSERGVIRPTYHHSCAHNSSSTLRLRIRHQTTHWFIAISNTACNSKPPRIEEHLRIITTPFRSFVQTGHRTDVLIISLFGFAWTSTSSSSFSITYRFCRRTPSLQISAASSRHHINSPSERHY